ncbi:FAD-dependent oxidoreductase [Breznakiella homolactica]|uniref:FAD-dependent oxidoreductase n=1 Tax=Breznakiella homolactica TaxID=2798577 RepID=A0A7T8BAP9_9SPIR|nr:FAD-dependent oxidoreductase [Breznakiella homolactica]QQO09621.1 FAD-dependent oxidoreductase [Breznakiella homolactica]
MVETVSADVAVIGAGPAGVCAALAAARGGAAVVLAGNRPVIGGNSSSEIRVWTRGASGGGSLYSEEMGILGELKLRNLCMNPEANVVFWDETLLDAVLAEPRITLFLNTHITGTSLGPDRLIESVRGFQMGSEKEFIFTAKYFIDATGDGSIGAQAGVPFTMGREGRDTYGEADAPEQGDSRTLGSTIFFMTKRTDRPVVFHPPEYVHGLEKIGEIISRGGRLVNETLTGCDYWWFEFGGTEHTIADSQDIALELKRIALGVWNYIKNSGQFDADTLTLEWVGSIPGKRESRRFTGAYVLKQQDVVSRREFEDTVAYGGWYMDFHPAGGVYTDEDNCVQLPVFIYNIPLRSLYNPDFPNLYFAGRDISVSHAVFSSSRIMNTCALTGHAAGQAAAYSAVNNLPPAGMRVPQIREVQDLLISGDLEVPGQKRSAVTNLAGTAAVTVSSVFEDFGSLPEQGGKDLALTAEWFLVLTKKAGARDCAVLAVSQKPVPVRCTISKQPVPSRLAADPLAEPTVLEIPAGENWVTVSFPQSYSDYEGFVVVSGEAASGVSLKTTDIQTTGFLAGLKWSADYRYPKIRADISGVYGAENLGDGATRPYTMPRSWLSGAEKEPSVTFEWDSPKEIKEVRLFFNPDLSRELPSSITCSLDENHIFTPRTGMPPELVKGYRVEIRSGGAWKTAAEVRDNWRRLSVCRFAEVTSGDALRVIVESTYGSPRAEVFEIEIY